MSSISTRWSVLEEHAIGPADRGSDGVVTDAAVARWVASARDAYLAQCARLQATLARGVELRDETDLPAGAALGPATGVVVSASATEVFPTAFVVALRLRALAGDSDVALNISSRLRIVDPVTGDAQEIDREMRDELIALEHSARHFN